MGRKSYYVNKYKAKKKKWWKGDHGGSVNSQGP